MEDAQLTFVLQKRSTQIRGGMVAQDQNIKLGFGFGHVGESDDSESMPLRESRRHHTKSGDAG